MKLEMNHIHIRCQDLEAALAFYTDIMGGELLGRGEALGMPIIRVGLGGAVLALSPPRADVQVEPFTGKPGYGTYQLGYTVPDIEQAYQDLTAKGVEFKGRPVQVREGLKAAFLAAPDGVEIELMEMG